ncbi:hypothetical protein GY45DRAFT_30855 [Cubamyces sp. BRFM 1775]|nr:hypothetical protein GY45DRAFT_30855 [Cubamyces sp. BRFM 1775]
MSLPTQRFLFQARSVSTAVSSLQTTAPLLRTTARAVVAAVQASCAAVRELSCADTTQRLYCAHCQATGHCACHYRFISALLNSPPATFPREPDDLPRATSNFASGFSGLHMLVLISARSTVASAAASTPHCPRHMQPVSVVAGARSRPCTHF